MWTDDLESVESCGFCRSLLNFDSIDSIGAHNDTDTFVYVKTPTEAWLEIFEVWVQSPEAWIELLKP